MIKYLRVFDQGVVLKCDQSLCFYGYSLLFHLFYIVDTSHFSIGQLKVVISLSVFTLWLYNLERDIVDMVCHASCN